MSGGSGPSTKHTRTVGRRCSADETCAPNGHRVHLHKLRDHWRSCESHPYIAGKETKEDFHHQSMPLPTIGVEAWHRFGDALHLETSAEGNWINRWTSLRDEGRPYEPRRTESKRICASSIPIPHGSDRLIRWREFSSTTTANSKSRMKTATSSVGRPTALSSA